MNLSEFLSFNKNCPICDRKLTLYMRLINSVTFKATEIKPNIYKLDQFMCKDSTLSQRDFITIYNEGCDSNIKFNTSKIARLACERNCFLFFLCNPNSFRDKSFGRYEIDQYKACYYRSNSVSKFLKMSQGSFASIPKSLKIPQNPFYKKWAMAPVSENSDNAMEHEAFTFKKKIDDLEKVYILDLNHAQKKTRFWKYSFTEEETKLENFEPKTFEKEIPYLRVRPSFKEEDRDKLLDRFDTWILMS